MATDGAAVAAALEQPETPLRRAVGTNDPFALDPVRLPSPPDAAKRSLARAPRDPAPTEQIPSAPAADRARLDAAESALRALDAGRKAEEGRFCEKAEALAKRAAKAQRTYVERRKAAAAEVVAARAAFRKAGGEV